MKNSIQEEKFASIIEAVSYWLGYQSKIGRSRLLHEASLRYPIADAITAQGTAVEKIVIEELHPIFKSKKIDLVIYDANVEEIDENSKVSHLQEVYEFKLAKYATGKPGNYEQQRVFNDVLRLAYHHHLQKKDCYFLMCGTYEEFKTYFVGQKNDLILEGDKTIVRPRVNSNVNRVEPFFRKWKPDGLYSEWFSFELGIDKEVVFDTKEKWGLQSFQEDYIIRDEIHESHPDTFKIKTICKAITPNGLENRTHAAGIWKIEAA